jgi:hypothetical protein
MLVQIAGEKTMNIYKVTREDGNWDYDQFEEVIVYANNPEEAKRIHPHGDSITWDNENDKWSAYSGWPHIDRLYAELLGKAKETARVGVIAASFKGG